MATLVLHGKQIESVFELLGVRENDITYSLGWVLSRCPVFAKDFLCDCTGTDFKEPLAAIALQSRDGEEGITDVEIETPRLKVIVEAKRGWELPTERQLAKYAKRFRGEKRECLLLVLSECSSAYTQQHAPSTTIGGVPVRYRSWADAARIAARSGGGHADKRLLKEFCQYLRRFVSMQDQESNSVYVVALSTGENPKGWRISWRGIVNEKSFYFHPFGRGGGWPKVPPNYVAFRYGGQLQTIHHIEHAGVVREMHSHIPEIPAGLWDPHILYTLGPAIRPAGIVKTGKLFRNGRCWAMLDLLLTSASISEARDRSRDRLKRPG